MRRLAFLFSLLACLLALSACRKDRPETAAATVGISTPNSFSRFLNPQASLGVADYRIVAATNVAGAAGSYTLTATYDNGATQTYNGSWTSSGGRNPTAAGNPTHALEMAAAGGITIELSSTVDTYLYLRNDANNTTFAEDNDSGAGSNARIFLPATQTNVEAYAQAYYAMIDSANERDTLDKWKTKNGFDSGYSAHVLFQDVRDLGYGRNMYVRGSTGAVGDVAAYVENFQVSAVPGLLYSALNLDAVVENDRRWHIGTNAIEYSAGPSGQRIAKFYTFAADGTRRLMVDLDGRGLKAMPTVCITCHGGRADPLVKNIVQDPTGQLVFPRQGNTWARMQGLDVDALIFSLRPGYTRAEQEAGLRTINQLVLCTYPLSAASTLTEDACRSVAITGEWSGNAGAALIKAWYGGIDPPAAVTNMPASIFSDTYVPNYWTPGTVYIGAVPAGANSIYSNVIAGNCRTCHILRGTNWQSDIDFSVYDTTLDSTYGYNERIRAHVFNRGKMPLALLVYSTFWGSGAGYGTSPGMLASWLTTTGFAPDADAGGNPLQPGRPIANPGPNNRTVTTPLKLSAGASLYTNSYQWSLVSSPSGSTPTLTNASSVRPTFDTNMDGAYVLRLVAGNGTAVSTPVDITVNVRNTGAWGAAPLPQTIRFSHIRNILQSSVAVYGGAFAAGCAGCHNPSGGYNMAVYYSDWDRVANGCLPVTVPACTDTDNLHQFYLDIRARVDFADPESSRLLRNPSGNHHGGGLVSGFDLVTPGGRYYYDIFLEWILNGAPE